MSVKRLACAWLLTAVLAPSSATAQSPQVDRDSPTGVEYQLPVERAREQAAGVLPGARRSTDEIPLFGVGVKRAARRASGARSKAGARNADRAAQGAATLGPAAPAIVRAEAAPPGGGGAPLLAAGAGGAGVLVLGALAGLGWRRRTRPR